MGWFLFFLVVVPFALMNITGYRRERREADEKLVALLNENNELLKKVLDSVHTH